MSKHERRKNDECQKSKCRRGKGSGGDGNDWPCIDRVHEWVNSGQTCLSLEDGKSAESLCVAIRGVKTKSSNEAARTRRPAPQDDSPAVRTRASSNRCTR